MRIIKAYSKDSATKKKSKSSIEHENWLKSKGLHISQIQGKNRVDSSWKKIYSDSLKVDRDDYVSAGMSGSSSACADRSIMTNLHKESEHTRKEILKKAARIAPLWNKGGLMVITDGQDLTTLGKKV